MQRGPPIGMVVGLVFGVCAFVPFASLVGATVPAAAVSAGGDHTCALTAAGGVQCWGQNLYGQLGDGTTTQPLTPVDVVGLTSGVAAVAAGENHTCALTIGGAVRCWGENTLGQLGNGTSGSSSSTPVDVIGLNAEVSQISAGRWFTCALTTARDVKCWGEFPYGGGGGFIEATPLDIAGLDSDAITLASGWSFGCAITGAGGVKCWGGNGVGQLGDGTTVARAAAAAPVSGLNSGVVAIAAGYAHACARSSSGIVECWGDNTSGQLGDGTTDARLTPVSVPGLASDVTAISAGGAHTCVQTATARVKCWGDNTSGQLGDGTTDARLTPVSVPGLASDVTAISAGREHTCVQTATAGVKCWGGNTSGQLGDGTTDARLTPVDVIGFAGDLPAAPTISSASVLDAAASVAFTPGGDGGIPITSFEATCTSTDGGLPGSAPGPASPIVVNGLTNGKTYTCTATATNAVGTSAPSAESNSLVPRTVPAAPTGVTASAGNTQATVSWTAPGDNGGAAVDGFVVIPYIGAVAQGPQAFASVATTQSIVGLANGTSYTFTVAATNAVGTGTESSQSNAVTPSAPPPTQGVQSVSTGLGQYACGLTLGGAVKCWGVNAGGQLGDGTTTGRLTPVAVSGLTSGVTALENGAAHSCVVTSAGGVKCWGQNFSGQLGDGTFTAHSTPADVPGVISGVDAIAVGSQHSCAVTTAGGLECWGANGYGQLGDGVPTLSGPLVDVLGLTSGVSAATAGENHTCALSTSGGVKCWGANSSGQVGDGTQLPRATPVDVSGLSSGIAAIAAGRSHTCAVTTAGAAKCWGDNTYGQLGDGTATRRLTPVQVSGLTAGVSAISAGADHTCALTTSGAVKCWGRNLFGQLGDATTTARSTPVAVSGLASGVTAISAGLERSCAVTAAAVAKCWGRNLEGQLGDATTTSRSVPVAVVGMFPGPPLPPTVGVATPLSGSIRLAFTVVFNGGSPISGFTVTCTSTNGGAPGSASGPASPIVVIGLTNGKSYTCKVTATNEHGPSAASAASNAAVPRSTPGAPTGVIAVPGNGQVTVSWTAPANNGGSAITGYTITPYRFGTVALLGRAFPATPTNQIMPGLTNGTPYTFKVNARNAAGSGPMSVASNTAVPRTVPSPPSGVVASPGNGRATVSWVPPTSNGGSAVIGYTVTPFLGTVAQPPRVFSSTLMSQLVSGLQNAKLYTFKVAARNVAGTGPPSVASAAIKTGSPVAPVVSAVGTSGQAVVSWAPPVNNGSAVTSYVVTPYIGTVKVTAKVHTVTCPCAATPTWTVTGLTNGTNYTFKVSAVSAIGAGPDGATTIKVAATGIKPGAPTALTAVAGDARVTVSWTAPASNGTASVNGYVITPYIGAVAQTPRNFASVATKQVITGLTNGTTYSFRVSAKNVVGVGPFAATGPATPTLTVPGSMAALGDSFSAGYLLCGSPAACAAGSWSTGTAGTVSDSHYQRLLAIKPAIGGHAFNDAVPGADMSGLASQVNTAVGQGVQYVTIMMGGNDACAPDEGSMTPVATFQSQFAAAMSTLMAAPSSRKVFVTSIPDVLSIYEAGLTHADYAAKWAGFPCQSMLDNPGSVAQVDVDRRANVRQRVIDYNTALATVCGQYAGCKFDNNAVFSHQWTASEISDADYIHPNAAGQAMLSALTYPAGFNW